MDKSVALRKESVDRNCAMQIVIIVVDTSLSARRAWIEIIDDLEPSSTRKVALRKESVDRNANFEGFRWWVEGSLSARRAWIEISSRRLIRHLLECRSPQGERG